jgi:hypothetical protein
MLTVYLDGLSVLVCLRPVSCVSNVDSLSEQTTHLDKLSTLNTQDKVEDKQEQTIHLDKLSTLDTQDTGRKQTRTDNPSR